MVVLWIECILMQAYLETDPSARGQPESYTARYKTFACSQVDAAIAKYDSLSNEIGEALRIGEGKLYLGQFSSFSVY